MTSVRLSKKIEERLSALSAKTHRPKSYFIKAALDRYLEDEEDFSLLVAAYETHLRNGDKTYSLESIKKELDLES